MSGRSPGRWVCAALLLLALPAQAGDLTVNGYTLVSSVRLSRTVFENTYRAMLGNGGPALDGATATLADHDSNLSVVDATLSFGPVAAGGAVTSTDTFVVRHDRVRPFDPATLVWQIEAREAPPPAGTFALTPAASRLRSGEAATLRLQLATPAGASGVEASLSSTEPSLAGVPATVAVAAGETQAFFSVTSLGPAGAATITALVAGASISAEVEVRPRLVEVALDSAGRDLTIGEVRAGKVTLASPAPAGGRSVALSLSTPLRATLSASPIVVAAGETTASFSVTATAAGSETVSAALTGAGADSASASFAIVPAVATTTTTLGLIDAALGSGAITEEQAFVYQVLAAFGSPTLPAQYQGAPSDPLDDPVSRELPLRFASLSPAAQAQLLPFLYPPAYAGSWGAPLLSPSPSAAPLTAAADPRKLKHKKKQKRAAQTLVPAVGNGACDPSLPGTPPLADGWATLHTAHFKVWYRTGSTSFSEGFYTTDAARQAAVEVAAVIEPIYEKLLGVFGAPPLSDETLDCNGGDGAIDVYVDRLSRSLKAQVVPYPPGACARPGWMWIAPDAASDAYETRNLLAHETVHLFQLVPNRADCSDPRWGILDEASATWAFDFVYPDDNYEHRFAVPSGLGNGYFADAFSGEWRMRPLVANRPVPAHGNNGYADYPFFEWLSRTFGPQTVSNINAATAQANPQQSFEVGLAGTGGGLRALWPKFALAAWNDWENHVEDAFYQWEHLADGSIKHGSIDPGNLFIEAKLEGASRRDLDDEFERIIRAPTSGNDVEDLLIGPMTARYFDIRFPDDDVSTVIFQLPFVGGDRYKVQALLKIDGEWKPVEDWTDKAVVGFCRDKKDERVEEMVVVLSNSHAGFDWFEQGPPGAIGFGSDVWPKLSISNSGCFRWKGTTHAVLTSRINIVDTFTADVTYEGNPLPVFKLVFGRAAFVPVSGTASVERSGVDTEPGGGCNHSIPRTTKAIATEDSDLLVFVDDVFLGESRHAEGHGKTPIDTTETVTCPNMDPFTVDSSVDSQWLKMPTEEPFAPLSDDGRSITGHASFDDGFGGTIDYDWDLHAEKEQ